MKLSISKIFKLLSLSILFLGLTSTSLFAQTKKDYKVTWSIYIESINQFNSGEFDTCVMANTDADMVSAYATMTKASGTVKVNNLPFKVTVVAKNFEEEKLLSYASKCLGV